MVYPCNNSQQQYRIAHAWYFNLLHYLLLLKLPWKMYILQQNGVYCAEWWPWNFWCDLFVACWVNLSLLPLFAKKRNHCCIDPRIKCWHAVLILQSTYIGSLNGFRLNYSSLLCIHLKRKDTYNKFFYRHFFPVSIVTIFS